MWRDHGTKSGLYKTPEELRNLNDQAELFRKTYNVPANTHPGGTSLDSEDPKLKASFEAHEQLYWYERNRDMTNFPHFFYKSEAEMSREAVEARKAFFVAEQLRRAGRRDEALRKYAEAIPQWRNLMLAHREFRQDSNVQEDAYEVELKYLDLIKELRGRRILQMVLLADYLAQAAVRPPGVTLYIPPANLARNLALPILSPFEVPDPEGKPLIGPDARDRVRSRMGVASPTPTPAPTPAATTTTPTTTP